MAAAEERGQDFADDWLMANDDPANLGLGAGKGLPEFGDAFIG
jgi:hypothetical protein